MNGKLLVFCCGVLLTAACQNPPAAPGRSPEQNNLPSDFEDGQSQAPSSKTLYAAARMLRTKGREAEYEAALVRTIREQPQCMPAYCDLARFRVRQGNTTAAIGVLTAGLQACPANPVLLNDLGMCRLMTGEHEAALRDFTKAASISPDNKRYRANMAVALGLLGRYEESLTLFEQVVNRDVATHNLAILRDARTRQPLRQ